MLDGEILGVSDREGVADQVGVSETEGVSEREGVSDKVVVSEKLGVSDREGVSDNVGVSEKLGVSEMEGVSVVVGVIERVGVMLTPEVVETEILGDGVSDRLGETLIVDVSELLGETLIEGDSEIEVVSLIVEEPEMLTDALGVSLSEPLSLTDPDTEIEGVSLCVGVSLSEGDSETLGVIETLAEELGVGVGQGTAPMHIKKCKAKLGCMFSCGIDPPEVERGSSKVTAEVNSPKVSRAVAPMILFEPAKESAFTLETRIGCE